MQDQTQMTNEPAYDDLADSAGSPIDEIISTVDSFISNPKTISPDSLQQLRVELEDLKTVLDGEQAPEEAQAMPAAQGGLAGMIGGR